LSLEIYKYIIIGFTALHKCRLIKQKNSDPVLFMASKIFIKKKKDDWINNPNHPHF